MMEDKQKKIALELLEDFNRGTYVVNQESSKESMA